VFDIVALVICNVMLNSSGVGVCVCVQVRRHFRPELLNRLDEIVIFDPLSHEQLRKVARLQMKDVAVRLAERGIALAVTDAALDIILSLSYDPVRDHSIHPSIHLNSDRQKPPITFFFCETKTPIF
jgi:phenylalanyl-tRNA synthetase beta subunit